MTENMGKWPFGYRKTEKSGHRLAAEKTLFPQRWYGGMISANLEAIWEMSDKFNLKNFSKRRVRMPNYPIIIISCVFALFGCSSGNHFMSEALEKRSPAELMRIQVFVTANPNAPIRRPHAVPYEIDGKEVPYAWTASGKHIIHTEPGKHIFKGLTKGIARILPNPKSPHIGEMVYEIYELQGPNISLPNAVSKPGHKVFLKPSSVEPYCEKLRFHDVLWLGETRIYLWKWCGGSNLIEVRGDFSGQARLYSWTEVVRGMENVQATGTERITDGVTGRSFRDWWREIKEQKWQEQ